MSTRSYPLAPEERRMLVANVVGSDVILALSGLACGLLAAVVAGGFEGAFGRFAEGLGLAFSIDAMGNALAGVALALLLCAIMEFVNALMFGGMTSYHDEVMRTRQGVNGELVRLPVIDLVWMMPVVGLSEELAFRYGLIGLTLALLRPLMGFEAAGTVAVVLSTVLFTLAHQQYNGLWDTSFVALYGALLGVIYTTTGSLLCVVVCHALYDFIDLLIERAHMHLEPDYFGGKVPEHALEDMVQDAMRQRSARSKRHAKDPDAASSSDGPDRTPDDDGVEDGEATRNSTAADHDAPDGTRSDSPATAHDHDEEGDKGHGA
jgi:membrane protease YdiL (CAAX protease family)